MKALELSKYIICKYHDSSFEGITPLKLQKLLYYTYVWGIVSNQKVLNDSFYKWQHGPVNPEVYHQYKDFGNSEISFDLDDCTTSLSYKDKEFVDFIVSNYAKFSALTLSAMTHQDKPWKDTETNQCLSDDSITSFYSNLNFAKNFPIDINKPFYPIETDLHYSFILDFQTNLSEEPFHYKSYKDYLELEKQSKEDFNEFFANLIET